MNTSESPDLAEKEKRKGEGKVETGMPWRVYGAHTLSTWGDNMWWFAGGCYMLELKSDNLRLTATYGLVIAASVIIFGASVGRWIDRTKRLTAAKTFLLVQNLCVSLCALLLAGFIGYRDQVPAEYLEVATVLVSIFSILFASLARLASSGVNIIIQKDWIVVIAENDTDRLAKMNSILRTIELTTYMLAPAAAGLLFTHLGFVVTGIVIAAWNIVSVSLEYLLLLLIYRKYPKLASFKASEDTDTASEDSEGGQHGNPMKEALAGWRIYLNHPVRNAGLGLAFLFLTVLGFDNITYGFCLLQGVPHAALGILVGVSALVGVLGSLSYPPIRARVGLERTGLMGMFLLISCSSLAVLSTFLPGSPMNFQSLVYPGLSENNNNNTKYSAANNSAGAATTQLEEQTLTFQAYWQSYGSVSVFLAGIILARYGLWIVDLTINQILQERVAEDRRGVVNGVQDSINNTFDLLKCVFVILLPSEETFALLIFISFASINFGWLMYALYSRSQRGHLFHFCRLVSVMSPDSPLSVRKEKTSAIIKENANTEEIEAMVKKYEDRLDV